MLTYLSIITLAGSLNTTTINDIEIHSNQNDIFQAHIAQAVTDTQNDDQNDDVEYIEWTFL
ncbi:MAG: hypothetical protein KZQ64_10000 [gamma proteobacterium symbiont of Bathyaustriella thionipta]|nr:hypothetical protein [gamma proteobacterium symbiont of Bathyaustriella thionipta]MCU7948660.1 hypothetical protein [gamma proteobacterium symbiont of Bathyaustriella thionipta]MCU7953702.1 hypothetical protein [gamma proteobacterium symbiont of Bathyaustriella thionipta]MCU7955191.1 hypothetical protein [gamma proteobacterium symbiont of Bathyaustriella thionipta]MCU7967086.1 hypothetical protein [gamma proteobacterium symbiont of Bathyaustriella thionipta]